ncbi:MAG TPA: diacylglycerol kinase family protein, partial [Candidatus Sulfotelmatobacter sp.]|nr:diacylglycerol kinase family protein [Candidatus Sulfotelmatobacter sp.]
MVVGEDLVIEGEPVDERPVARGGQPDDGHATAGEQRMIALLVVVVVAAAAGFGTGLAFAGISVWRVILIVALGGVSVLAARYALRRMAGGDGSQALVASVAARHEIPHVCVPAGTRNHFALDLGLDRNDVVGALDA